MSGVVGLECTDSNLDGIILSGASRPRLTCMPATSFGVIHIHRRAAIHVTGDKGGHAMPQPGTNPNILCGKHTITL